jgi:hypothetical protein
MVFADTTRIKMFLCITLRIHSLVIRNSLIAVIKEVRKEGRKDGRKTFEGNRNEAFTGGVLLASPYPPYFLQTFLLGDNIF